MNFRRKVTMGSQTGRKIGYPTINLNVGSFAEHYSQGIYTCRITVEQKEYKGALYFGCTMHHKNDVLEIHILNFSDNIYGQFIRFTVGKKIRAPKKFGSLEELKKQISIDLRNIV